MCKRVAIAGHLRQMTDDDFAVDLEEKTIRSGNLVISFVIPEALTSPRQVAAASIGACHDRLWRNPGKRIPQGPSTPQAATQKLSR